MKHKTIIAIILLICLLATGCANVVMPVSMPEPETSKTVSEIIEEIAGSLPDTSEFHGEKLIVMTDDPTVITGNEETAGLVNGALEDRDALLESRYGMEIQVKQLDADALLQEMQAASVSGTAACDLLCYPAEITYLLYAEGLLTDLTELPYFDAATACSSPDTAAALQTGSSLYFLPDPSAHAYGSAYVLFYDRALVESTGLAAPESLVIDGKWDMQAFQRYAERVASSVMNKESFDLQQDIFGYSSQDNTAFLPYLLWRGQGYELFSGSESGRMTYTYGAETLTALFAPQKALFASDSRYLLDGNDAYTAFNDGRLGFLVAELDYIKELYANSAREYGLLPLPKANGSSGEYVCPTDTAGRVLSVPKLVRNRKRCGVGLTAICAAGGSLLHEAEKQTYINLYSRDNDQTCMLEIILDAAVFDFAMLFAPHEESVDGLSARMFAEVTYGDGQFDSFIAQYGEKFGEYASENLS